MKAASIQINGDTVPAFDLEDRWINVRRAYEDYNRDRADITSTSPMRGVADLIGRGLLTAAFHGEMTAFVRGSGQPEAYLLPADAPLAMPYRPGKVIAIGKNYRAHVKEFDGEVPEEPLFFVKSATACIGPEAPIVLEDWYGRVDHEGEYGVVIGKPARHIAKEDARDYVAGYTLVNDVTAREIQRADIAKGKPWFRAKNLDTFCPFGPSITLADAVPWPLEEDIAVRVNGETRQDSNTRVFIFDLPTLLAYVSRHMTLEPGDIVATGTPEGVSPLKPGDVVEVTAARIGTLRNPVVSG